MTLEGIGAEIWLVQGPTVSFYGFPYPTRMAVVRLADRALWVWSPVQLSQALRRALEEIGTPRYLVAPNKLHHLYLGEWQQAWPQARVYAAPGLRERRPDLRFDAELGSDAAVEWSGEIDQVVFRGSFAMEEVVFFHRQSRTVLVCDLIQRFDPESLPPLRRAIMRVDGMVGPDGSTPREWRATFWNRRVARAALEKALGWKCDRLVIAHGRCALENGNDVLRTGLRWLRPAEAPPCPAGVARNEEPAADSPHRSGRETQR
jgi:Domain of unknown function (DUF4336)